MARRQQDFGQKETTRLLADGMNSLRESEEIAIATGDSLRGQRGILEGIRGECRRDEGSVGKCCREHWKN